MKSTVLHAFFALVVSTSAASAFGAAANVKVTDAWARATAPGQKIAAVYMNITSDSNATLVGAESSLAGRAELHSMTMDGGVMRMRPLPKIELEKDKTAKLAPNGAHLMLVNLKRPLKAGTKIPLTLSIQVPGASPITVDVQAEVRGLTESPEHKH